MIQLNIESNVATLALADSKVNAMNIEWCQLFSAQLAELEHDDNVRAVVLTSAERVFSAGVDLKRVVAEEPQYVQPFIDSLSKCFRDAFVFPKPLVVAINGHAIAGGCIVASCGDFRVATPRARIGLPELRVGVPLPAIAIEIIRRVASPVALQAMLNSGANYRGKAAVEVGLADEIVEKESLLEAAREHADLLASIPHATFRLMKQQIREPSLVQADRLEEKFGQQVREVWNSSEIRAMIEQYAAKL
ncbi:enoyl-CoA hydratase/isomerase family protein [Mariniblastus fucicola]|nr:enoyl-CoA hydratase/isomerase family protein [Mariniblastus fucicola]